MPDIARQLGNSHDGWASDKQANTYLAPACSDYRVKESPQSSSSKEPPCLQLLNRGDCVSFRSIVKGGGPRDGQVPISWRERRRNLLAATGPESEPDRTYRIPSPSLAGLCPDFLEFLLVLQLQQLDGPQHVNKARFI